MKSDRPLVVVLVALSGGYLAAVGLISQPAGQYAAVGPRAFPLVVGRGLLVCSAAIAFQVRDEEPPVPVDWYRFLGCALWFFAYLGFFETVGHLVSNAVFITCQARLLGSTAWRRNVFCGVTVSVAIYALLDRFLGLPLPPGWLG